MIEAYLFALSIISVYAFIGAGIATLIGFLVWRYVLCSTCFITLLSRCSFLSIFDWGILTGDSLCDKSD